MRILEFNLVDTIKQMKKSTKIVAKAKMEQDATVLKRLNVQGGRLIKVIRGKILPLLEIVDFGPPARGGHDYLSTSLYSLFSPYEENKPSRVWRSLYRVT